MGTTTMLVMDSPLPLSSPCRNWGSMNVCGNEGQPLLGAGCQDLGQLAAQLAAQNRDCSAKSGSPHLDFTFAVLTPSSIPCVTAEVLCAVFSTTGRPRLDDMEFVCQTSSPAFQDVHDADSTHTAASLPPA